MAQMQMSNRKIYDLIFLPKYSEWEQIAVTERGGIPIWLIRKVMFQVELRSGLTWVEKSLKYFGRTPPEIIPNRVYIADIQIRDIDIGNEYILVNDKNKTGPKKFILKSVDVEQDNSEDDTEGSTEVEEEAEAARPIEPGVSVSETVSKSEHSENSENSEKLNGREKAALKKIEEWKQSPDLDFVLIAQYYIDSDVKVAPFDVSEDDGKNIYSLASERPIDFIRQYHPDLEDYLVEIPTENIVDKIARLTAAIDKGVHPNTSPDSVKNQEANFDRMRDQIDGLKQLLQFIVEKLGIDLEPEEEEQLSEEEIYELIAERNKELAEQPDDLTKLEGVGDKTATDLIEAGYDSYQKILDAKDSDLMKVPGVGTGKAMVMKKSAEKILSPSENQAKREMREKLDKVTQNDPADNEIPEQTVVNTDTNIPHIKTCLVCQDQYSADKGKETTKDGVTAFMCHDCLGITEDELQNDIGKNDETEKICGDCGRQCTTVECDFCDSTHPGCWTQSDMEDYHRWRHGVDTTTNHTTVSLACPNCSHELKLEVSA